jgi:chorismate synthase
MANTLGTKLRLHTWGESHGERIGGVVDGFPAGVEIDFAAIQAACDRRKPGQNPLTTPRKESDIVQFHSGIFEGKTTGTPIAFSFENTNTRSKDYDKLKDVYRPGHADATYEAKYGHRDHRGGGRSSARETANWVVAGALAKHLLPEVEVRAYVSEVGGIAVPKSEIFFPSQEQVDASLLRCPHPATEQKMIELLELTRREGDSLGGIIHCEVRGVPAGLGDPVFAKLHAQLGMAMLSINAVKGFEYGAGFGAARLKGSEHNDVFDSHGKMIENRSGGIVGGIANGENISFNVAFKPVASISIEQNMPTKAGGGATLPVKGRHDPCVVPRAVPIVEALTYFVIADLS